MALFLSAESSYNVTFKDSIGSIHGAIDAVKGSVDGVKGSVDGLLGVLGSIDGKLDLAVVDTNVDYDIYRRGELMRDSILEETGLGSVDIGNDTSAFLAADSASFTCVGDSCCVGPSCMYLGSEQHIRDSLAGQVQAYADTVRQRNEAFKRDSLSSYISQVKDSVRSWNPLGAFDSTILNTLGARIPNSNTCPDHCGNFQVNVPFAFGVIPLHIDYGICQGYAPLGGANVLSYLRFLLRLLVAIACVYTIMWNAAGRKGG